MACDICGKATTDLEALLERYQAPDIKMICPDCLKTVNKQHSDLLTVVLKMRDGWLNEWIRNMKLRLTGK
jgi:hypothetical protein